ncbi:MAG: PorP/SprF family type IX secretion system membrane protein [Bacteroidaceae bacterium]|nr:PorP/SprF family type IX secretion system membrane protein [Bacteroidaceae bacterium]
MNKKLRIPSFLAKLVLTLLSQCFVADMIAQQEPEFAHYFELETQFNPAAVGKSTQLLINGAYQSHATGYDDAGGTMLLMANTAFQVLGSRHGVGALFQNDEIGLFSTKRFALQYAFHFKLFGGVMSVGAEADMINESVDGTKVDLADANDPAFPGSEMTGSAFGFTTGLYYQRGAFHAGVSAMHLTSPKLEIGETNEYQLKPHYYFTAGYNIRTHNPFFKIEPRVLLRYDGTEFRANITAALRYEREKKRLYGGVTYTPERSVTAFVGGQFHGVNLSYSYEAFTSGLGLGYGQHEVTLGYSLDLDFSKRGRNYHKSVRWL